MGKTKRYKNDEDVENKIKNHYRRNRKKFYVKDMSHLDELEEMDDEYFENFSKIKRKWE